MKPYLTRLIEKRIAEKLQQKGCVLIEGPKWCGKSTTAKRFAKTIVELQKSLVFKQYRILADTANSNMLAGEKPIMFDEWQKIPELWDDVRAEIDTTGERGQFILTGSTKPIEDSTRHSGTGRIARLIMYPLSLWESQDSTGAISLESLFEGNIIDGTMSDVSLERLAFLACRGGWPDVVFDTDKNALAAAPDYLNVIVRHDLIDAGVSRINPERAKAILRAYARNISTPAKITTIQNDIVANDFALDIRTLDSYITAFRNLFIIEDLEAWSPSLRSKTTIRTKSIKQFTDPSIATAAQNIAPQDLMKDLHTFGFVFETMAIRDLRVYADSLGGQVFQYHDADGLEIDAIIHLENGNWGAIEIKLGGDCYIEEAAKNLLKLRKKINTANMKEPSFLMVLTGTQYSYRRADGVVIVPLACLKD